MNITVYLGANKGIDDTFSIAVRELGKWIGANGHTLIYGGSKTGLMGELAESVLMEGGRVTGVEPQFFVEAEVQYDEITELIVTKDMTERKTKMIELGDAFIAFPGGTGTLEEITEVMSKLSLNQLSAPCIFYNLNGYYDSIKEFLSLGNGQNSLSTIISSLSAGALNSSIVVLTSSLKYLACSVMSVTSAALAVTSISLV